LRQSTATETQFYQYQLIVKYFKKFNEIQRNIAKISVCDELLAGNTNNMHALYFNTSFVIDNFSISLFYL